MAGYAYKGSNPSESSRSTGRPPTFRPELCGTTAGYMQHYRRKDKRCEPCHKAKQEYDAERRARKKAATVTTIAGN
jgi:hypothetical protein